MDGELRHWKIKGFTQIDKETLPELDIEYIFFMLYFNTFPSRKVDVYWSKINFRQSELFSKTMWGRTYFSLVLAEGLAE